VDAHAPAVSRLVAFIAAAGLVKLEVLRVGDVEPGELLLAVGEGQVVVLFPVGRVGLLAVAAERSREPLGQDPQKRVGEVQRVDAHVEQADDRLGSAVGVQRREHEVPRERGLDADLGRLEVAHLADHDHIGIGAQEGPQRAGEIEADLGVHLDLPDPVLGDFDGVLDRPDLAFRRVDAGDAGVQSRRLARSRGAHAQDDPVGLLEQLDEVLVIPG